MRLCFVKFISLLHALSADKSAPGCPHTDTIENWSDNGLESLPNWEAFDVKPTVLDMSGNVIKSLEADGLIDYACLRYVSFRNNAIRDVNPMAFNGLAVSLIHLDLAGNKINTIVNVTFSYIPKLETLLLSNNSVTNLDRTVFADLKVLHSLDLSLNYLSYILDGTFDWNEKLEFLSLSHNRIEIISKFTFKMLRNLKHLDLSDNNISFLHRNAFLSLRQLEWISLSNNKIKQLHKNDFGSLKQVKYFNLSTNELRDIKSRLFLNCTRLQNLSIAHNQIIELQQEALYGLFDLRYFDLSHNKLAHLSPDMFISNKSQLSSNRTLPPPNHHSDTVCTEYNSPNYSLTTFRLNNNSITSLDQCAFVPARGLQVIDLAANNLSALDYRVFCPLTKLSSLDIAFNKLTTIDYPGAEWIRDTETAINFTGNPWNCSCNALYNAYKVLHAQTRKNVTLLCERPEDGAGETWNILEEKCELTTSAETAATYEVTETPLNNTTENSVIVKGFGPKPSPKMSIITPSVLFIICFAAVMCVAIAVVLIMTRKIKKINLNHSWWEDQLTRKDLMSG